MAESQPMHSDIGVAGNMVSAHLALHDVGAEDGATAFCLGSHIVPTEGITKGFGAAFKILALLAVRAQGRQGQAIFCPNPFLGTSLAGEVTIYDSALHHYGTANVGRDFRTVFNLNIARHEEVIAEENYTKNFNPRITAAQQTLKTLAWMREAFDEDFLGLAMRLGEIDAQAFLQHALKFST